MTDTELFQILLPLIALCVVFMFINVIFLCNKKECLKSYDS